MTDLLLSPIPLSELETLIQNSVRKVLSEKHTDTPSNLPGQLTIEQAVLVSIQNGTPLKKSHIYKETMLSGNGQNDFPVKKFGRKCVIPRKEFIDWLNKNTISKVPIIENATTHLANEANKKLNRGKKPIEKGTQY